MGSYRADQSQGRVPVYEVRDPTDAQETRRCHREYLLRRQVKGFKGCRLRRS